jgi:hypothetical protein
MMEPLKALQRVRRVTGEAAVIETLAIRVLGQNDASLLAFDADNAWNADFSNWFAPTQTALIGMCRAAGFRRVEPVRGPPPVASWRDHLRPHSGAAHVTYRASVIAYTQ